MKNIILNTTYKKYIIKYNLFNSSFALVTLISNFNIGILYNKVFYSGGKVDVLDRVNFIKSYLNADKDKLYILKENTEKSGIY